MAGLLALAAPAHAVPQVPTGFIVENAVPGAVFDTPTGIAFMPDGRMLVCQKEGTLWVVQNGTKIGPILDIKNVVLNQGDRGLLDVAVDPEFSTGATNKKIYLLYTVDPDSNNVDTNDDAYGKLVSYQMTTTISNTVDLNSRKVLFGRTWTEGPTSTSVTHTIGSLRWGADKSLIVSVGEGAHYEWMDDGGDDVPAFQTGRTDPIEDIGAFRAQYLGSLAGKILRLNPANGNGYTSNPFYTGDVTATQSKVYDYGLRNPFRFCMRPGTGNTDPTQGRPGTIYLGDVGWSTWEEMSIATQPGRNFGWPCREGLHTTTYQGGSNPAHNGCNSVGSPENPSPFTPPVSDWHHSNPNNSSPSGVIGNAASGSVFYSGTSYPTAYRGNYLFSDYGQSWIRLAQVDANDNVISFQTFGTNMEMPVDMVADPASKDIYYVSISMGQVRRIRYVGPPNGNPPVAMASANPTTGSAPLTVNFSSAGSNDPDFDPITYTWDFADGSGSFEQNPTHVYTVSGIFLATLTVNDNHGGSNTKTVQITVGDVRHSPAPRCSTTSIARTPARSASTGPPPPEPRSRATSSG
jgi:glucose/arabinose dehydrogenase